jgi:glutathione peroxidase
MKKIISCALMCCLSLCSVAQEFQSFHDLDAETITGELISMSQYAGKKLLVVNTASYCGYTHQFGALEQLDSIYANNNFEVIGFPCNDFGGQDPGTDEEILEFCQGTYGVSFQMMSRVSITASDTSEIYKWLQLASRNGVADAPVTWNFHKFCIDEYGNWVMHFPSEISPFDTQITDWIMSETPTSVVGQPKQSDTDMQCMYANGTLRVTFTGALSESCELMVHNVAGALVGSQSSMPTAGSVFTWTTDVWSAGWYFVTARSGEFELTKKVWVGR